MSKPEEISDFINQLSFDLKAEMLVALLMESQAEIPEINVVFEGQHKRVWSHDIECAAVESVGTGEEKVSLYLNRDGIYDLLPEALFHGIRHNESRSGDEMARQSRELRAEEKEARLFFQPFENEIFLRGVQLSMIENSLYRKINSELYSGMIPELWKINEDLPPGYVSKLKKLLPSAYKVCGDMDLTAQCLAYILDEDIKQVTSTQPVNYTDNSTQLSGIDGSSILGTDFIPGNCAGPDTSSLTFMIGPVRSHDAIDQIKDGSMDRFMECFYGYFIPAGMDACTRYIFRDEEGAFSLNDEADKSSYLAYNSVLQ